MLSRGVILHVWRCVWASHPPSRLQGIAPFTSCSVTEKTKVIDQSHHSNGRLDSSSFTAGETLVHFLNSAVTLKRSTCWNKAGGAPVFSSMSLLFSLEPEARCDCATETFCSSALTRAHTASKKERYWEEGGRIVQNK